tara:strand:- start:1376 stop:1651 length:276 start_codon:yes stop_codon:yes gene_type:complete
MHVRWTNVIDNLCLDSVKEEMIRPILLPPSYISVKPKKQPVEKDAKRPLCEDEKNKRPKSTDSDQSSNDVMELNFAKSKKAKTSTDSERYR